MYSRPKAAFPFARSEWREPSYSLTPTTHTESGRYGPHKLDYFYCITGNSGISQPAEINITFLHITEYLGYPPGTEFSIPFVFAYPSKRSKSLFPWEKFCLKYHNVILELKYTYIWAGFELWNFYQDISALGFFRSTSNSFDKSRNCLSRIHTNVHNVPLKYQISIIIHLPFWQWGK